jgi:hypothetical protein
MSMLGIDDCLSQVPGSNGKGDQRGWVLLTDNRSRRHAQGFYFFLGRADDMFVSGGENIYPSELEKILEQHPAIQQVCVVHWSEAGRFRRPQADRVLISSLCVLRPSSQIRGGVCRASPLCYDFAVI